MIPGGLRSPGAGSVVRAGVAIVLSIALIVASAFAVGLVGLPSIERVDNEFGAVDDERTEIRTWLTVDNPNPIGGGSADVSTTYTVSLNDVEMAEGNGPLALEPGTSTERFSTHLENERIPAWWVTHVENGERTTVAIDATVHSGALGRSATVTESRTIETDILSGFRSDEHRTVNAKHPLVDDPVLTVTGTRAAWGDVDARHTELDLRFDVYNHQPVPIPLTQLGYEIAMNDVVVGLGESSREYVLAPGQETTVATTTRIRNAELDDWWVTHVENGEVTDLRIEFDGRVTLPGGITITAPFEELTYEETIETDIWGNDGRSPGGSSRDDEHSRGADGDGTDPDETDHDVSDSDEADETEEMHDSDRAGVVGESTEDDGEGTLDGLAGDPPIGSPFAQLGPLVAWSRC